MIFSQGQFCWQVSSLFTFPCFTGVTSSFISLFWCSASVKGYTFDTSAILEVFGSTVRPGRGFWACTCHIVMCTKKLFPHWGKVFWHPLLIGSSTFFNQGYFIYPGLYLRLLPGPVLFSPIWPYSGPCAIMTSHHSLTSMPLSSAPTIYQ